MNIFSRRNRCFDVTLSNHVYFLFDHNSKLMFDLTFRQTEEEWNKTGVWVLKTLVNKKDLC